MRSWVERFIQDLTYGFRRMRQSPGFTLVAIASLALGIGASTAIFSVIYGALISPYPYAKSNEIWAPEIRAKNPREGRGYSLGDFLEMRKLPAFADVMATGWENVLLTGDHAPEALTGVRLSGSAFPFLGVAPVIGRTILPSDITSGGEAAPVVVLSFKAWHRWFEGDPAALGKTLLLNDQPHTVIGVMPPRFGWYGNEGVWLPLATATGLDRGVNPIVRLSPGVSRQAAEEQLHALHRRLAEVRPKEFPASGFTTRLVNYMDITVASGQMRSSLLLLFGAVGFLLLIACANVANLQLARGSARSREIAVRMSVGAGRSRVFRQLLTESVALSVIGGAGGMLLSLALTKGIVALMPEFYLPNEARITVNVYVLLFSLAVSLITGIVFGLAPAFHCSRPDLIEALKVAGRAAGSGVSGGRTRNLLVVAELALSVILLVGASLSIRGFVDILKIDAGFAPDRVMLVSVPLPPKRYATFEQRNRFVQTLLDRISSLPGVESAAIGSGGLPLGGPQSTFSIEGSTAAAAQRIKFSMASADYARTLGIALRAGRGFTEQDILHAEHVALINQAATRLWPAGESPIGKRLRLDLLVKPAGALLVQPGGSPEVTVVGVLADTRNAGLRNPTVPEVYVPFTLLAPPSRGIAVKAVSKPTLLLNAIRQEVAALDKDQPITRPLTLAEVLEFDTVQPRFNMALFTFFGMLGLALAAVGVFSVLSYVVARRTHEIGIRVALGAERHHVLSLVFAIGGKLVLVGLAAGLAGSYLLAHYLRSEVFEVPATDPLALAAAVVLLCVVALLACYLPARRAARLEPLRALRHE